jgi:1-acyl-sn-glycerol-3-phosphate acyltransferase
MSAEARRPHAGAQHVDVYLPDGHQRGEVMSRGQRIFYRMVWSVVVAIARTVFRVQVIGRPNVPETGPFILSPIHRSNLDTPVIAAITRRRLRYMGKESLWRSRFGGWFFTTAGGFPVQRDSADRDALRAGREVLERGEPLVLFPEGTRQSGPVVQPLFQGAAYLACRTGAPIVPVGIGGSEAAMPKGSRMVRPRRMVLVVGAPLYPPPPGPSGRVPRRAVAEMTTELAEVIQVLFDEAQQLAGTPNVR